MREPSTIETLAEEFARWSWDVRQRHASGRDAEKWIVGARDRLIAFAAAIMAIVLPLARNPGAEREEAPRRVVPSQPVCPGYTPGRWDAAPIPGDHGDHYGRCEPGRRCKHCDRWEREHDAGPDSAAQSTTAGIAAASWPSFDRDGGSAPPSAIRYVPGGIDIASEIARRRLDVRRRMANLGPYEWADGRALASELVACDDAGRALLHGDIEAARAALMLGPETRREGTRHAIPPPPPDERAGWPTAKEWSFPEPAAELTFGALRAANVARCVASFKHTEGLTEWSPSDWAMACAGELGELCNLLKKQRRGERIDQSLVEHELADTLIYLDLLAARLRVDLGEAVVAKFNLVSDQVGSAIKLGALAADSEPGEALSLGRPRQYATRLVTQMTRGLGRIPSADEVRELMGHLDATRAELSSMVGTLANTVSSKGGAR